jgi:hypothetical protein
MTVWYRAVEKKHYDWVNISGDEESTPLFREATVELVEYEVIKVTPQGVKIADPLHWRGYRFVLKDARKRFACSTKHEAIESFRARKLRQLSILRSQARVVESAMRSLDKKPAGDLFS